MTTPLPVLPASGPSSHFWKSVHDLRHTVASLMLAAGEHPKVVQELLGHANISITLDTYSHVATGMQRAAVGRLGAALSAARD
jgi:integrase